MFPNTKEEERLPKYILKYVWSPKVLKAGLGVTTDREVEKWFAENPQVEAEFALMRRQLANGIKEIQNRTINGLRYESNKNAVQFDTLSNKRLRDSTDNKK